MKRGEIWLVKLDKQKSVGHEYYNDRPALIIMSNKLIRTVNVITIMPITSSVNQHKNDIIILKSKENRLYKDSIIKVHHVVSYDKDRLIHRIGVVDEGVMDEVYKYLKLHFGI